MSASASVPLFLYGRRLHADSCMGRHVCLSVQWIRPRRYATGRPTRKVKYFPCYFSACNFILRQFP